MIVLTSDEWCFARNNDRILQWVTSEFLQRVTSEFSQQATSVKSNEWISQRVTEWFFAKSKILIYITDTAIQKGSSRK